MLTKEEKAQRISEIKRRLYELEPFSDAWNRVARELWAVEDAKTID